MPPLSQKWIRIIRTVNLYLSFFGLGLCVSITGPTLIDLGTNVKQNTEVMSYMLAGRSAAYLGGSFLGGFLLDRFNRQILIIICVFVIGASNFSIPWWKTFWALTINVVFGGFFMGALDTGGGVLCLDIWKEKPDPYIQALHFMYGAGSFVSPFIAEAFFGPSSKNHSNNETETLRSNEIFENTTAIPPTEGYIFNAYAIVSVYMALLTISFIVFYVLYPTDFSSNQEKVRSTTTVSQNEIGRISLVVIVLACVQMMAYVGLENTFSQFLASFAYHSDMKLSKNTGAFMTSVFWGAFMANRFVSIFSSTRFIPFYLLLFNIVTMNIGSVLLMVWGVNSLTGLWVGTVILGIGMSSTFPAIYSWAEKYIGISNTTAGIFLTCGSFGGIMLQLLTGFYIEDTPLIVMYVTLGSTITCFIIFIIQWGLRIVLRNKIVSNLN